MWYKALAVELAVEVAYLLAQNQTPKVILATSVLFWAVPRVDIIFGEVDLGLSGNLRHHLLC